MKNRKIYIVLCALFLTVFVFTMAAHAAVPIRVSVKFILDANGNRPTTGNLNTDAEITAELVSGDQILRSNFTEYEIHVIERVDLAGVSQFYSSSASGANRDALRTAAIAAPATYHWRNDAINIFINGGTGSAISQFPPGNDIILMNQG